MKIHLIFPPVSPQFHMPYLSVPALVAYLRKVEPHWQVKSADLNILLARKIIEPDGIARFKEALRDMEKQTNDISMKQWFASHRDQLKKIEKFLDHYRDKWLDKSVSPLSRLGIYFSWMLKFMETWLIEVLSSSVNVLGQTQVQTMKWAEEFPEGIMTEFFEREAVPEILNFNPDLLGISWVDEQQVLPTLVLLKYLRKRGFKGRIVVGGPYISLIWNRLKNSPLTEVFDYFVFRQGEEPLWRLGKALETGRQNDIKQFIEPKEADVNLLPPPDFSDFPLDRYLTNSLRLSILGSWGCYWGKCSFCNVRKLEGVSYQPREPQKIVEDMIEVKERFKPAEVRLADNAIPFSVMVKIAKMLVERDVNLPWLTNTRFDGTWTQDGVNLLARSSCAQLLFGLETASEDVLRLVNKGTDLKRVRMILGLIANTRIWAHFYMIVGHPGDSREEWEKTLQFFKDISRRYPTLRFSTHLAGFGLQIQSHMYHHPKVYGIEEIEEPDPAGWSTLCRYKLSPPFKDLLAEPGIYEEMRKKLTKIYTDHLRRQTPLKHKISTRFWQAKMKLKLLK